MKNLVTFLILSCLINTATAQDVTGEWYGIGYVDRVGEHNSYLSEMKLTQKGTKVTGEFNYYYRTDEIKTKITGRYDSSTRILHLNAAPILNFQARGINGADCPMQGQFTLLVSKVETTLSGQFKPTKEYKITCPAINIKFNKSIPPPPPPPPPPPFPEFKEPVIKKRDTVPITKVITAVPKPVTTPDTVPVAAVKKPVENTEKIVKNLNRRSFEQSPVIEVDSDSLKVSIYDNGDIDNDTVTLFYNRKLLTYQRMLSDMPIIFTVYLDTTVTEIAMYAENLGKIPPNTALAVIYAGEKKGLNYFSPAPS